MIEGGIDSITSMSLSFCEKAIVRSPTMRKEVMNEKLGCGNGGCGKQQGNTLTMMSPFNSTFGKALQQNTNAKEGVKDAEDGMGDGGVGRCGISNDHGICICTGREGVSV
jgi:hypothetical protein